MFITEDFLLKTESAKKLYHGYAEGMPIADYHCHLNPREIYENKRFENVTEIWLGGDHYKWRLIRTMGTAEDKITGEADPYEKFLEFAKMLPRAIGNPMYHWTHLELKRYFGYDGVLNEETAEEVYRICNERLRSEEMSARSIIKNSGVKMIGTTDDPIDSLEWHRLLREEKDFDVAVKPSFRPDKAVNIEKAGFAEYIGKLAAAAEMKIESAADVKKALARRLDLFCSLGCCATDHGLDYVVYAPASEEKIEEIFRRAMAGETLSLEEADAYKTSVLLFLGEEYAKRGLVMQLHYGVRRNGNTKKFEELGPDTGFDCISTKECAGALVSFLDALEKKDALPKTIIYSLNPHDNELIDTVIGSFQGGGVPSKVQHGSAWWFNDTKSGMEAQLRSLANLSVLGNFVGMLTDSRSFLSYTRHEYFRRILCNLLGQWVEDGEYPNDEKALGQIVRDICYGNAARYFGLEDGGDIK